MNVYAIKDVLANHVTETGLYDNLDVLKRSLKNTFSKPSQHPYHLNPEDFRIYAIGTIDDINCVLTASDPEPLFYLSELINENLVQ